MAKSRIKLIPLREAFSNWRKFQKGDRGLILVENGNGLKIEKSGKLKGGVGYRTVPEGQKIFLGKIKKPALRVGFLNACLAKICPCNPKKIKVPVLSRLQMERIAEEFELMGKLEKKARGLELKVDLRIARVI